MSQPHVRRSAPSGSVGVAWLHTGGCAACADSLESLAAPQYAPRLRALGVTLTRLPRHSDILLLCGALTPQALDALRPIIAEIPQPRALVAVGECAINQCVFAGSPALTLPLAQALDVNVEIGGCPPTPNAILDAIATARRLLAFTPDLAPDAPIALAQDALTNELSPQGAVIAERVGSVTAATPPEELPPPATADTARRDRLAALIEAARGSWDDDEDDDDAASAGTRDAALVAQAAPEDLADTEDPDASDLRALGLPRLPTAPRDTLPGARALPDVSDASDVSDVSDAPDGLGRSAFAPHALPDSTDSSGSPAAPDPHHVSPLTDAPDVAPSTPRPRGARHDARRGLPREENSR